VHKVEHP